MIYLIKVGNPRGDDIEMIISAKDKSKAVKILKKELKHDYNTFSKCALYQYKYILNQLKEQYKFVQKAIKERAQSPFLITPAHISRATSMSARSSSVTLPVFHSRMSNVTLVESLYAFSRAMT